MKKEGKLQLFTVFQGLGFPGAANLNIYTQVKQSLWHSLSVERFSTPGQNFHKYKGGGGIRKLGALHCRS